MSKYFIFPRQIISFYFPSSNDFILFFPVKIFHFIFPVKIFHFIFPRQMISFYFPPSNDFILFFPVKLFYFSPSNYFILFFPFKIFHFIFPCQNISFYFSLSKYFILFFPRQIISFYFSPSNDFILFFPVKLFHLSHLVAAFSAANVDDDVRVGVLGQGLGDAGLSTAEGPRDGGGAPQHAGEEGVQHPLAGEQRVVGVQLLAHGTGLTNGPHLKTRERYGIKYR